MNSEQFSRAMNEIGDPYVEEAARYRARKGQKIPLWLRWGAAAACLCLVLAGGMLAGRSGGSVPHPDPVQVTNPIVAMESRDEMETWLDFAVPLLDKEVAEYSVFVEDGYPVMGQVDYADGSEFRIRYGSGDISGIYGADREDSREVAGVTVDYYRSGDTAYAAWEQGGFTCSYVYSDPAEVEELVRQIGQ